MLDGERGQSAHATASSLLLLEALRQQAALHGEGVERREGGGHLAGAGAGQVVQRETGHAGVAVGVEGLGTKVEAAGAIGTSFCHGVCSGGRGSVMRRRWAGEEAEVVKSCGGGREGSDVMMWSDSEEVATGRGLGYRRYYADRKRGRVGSNGEGATGNGDSDSDSDSDAGCCA